MAGHAARRTARPTERAVVEITVSVCLPMSVTSHVISGRPHTAPLINLYAIRLRASEREMHENAVRNYRKQGRSEGGCAVVRGGHANTKIKLSFFRQ